MIAETVSMSPRCSEIAPIFTQANITIIAGSVDQSKFAKSKCKKLKSGMVKSFTFAKLSKLTSGATPRRVSPMQRKYAVTRPIKSESVGIMPRP